MPKEKNPNSFFKRLRRGFSLLEMIVYIAIMVFLLAIIINSSVALSSFQRSINAQRSVENSAMLAIERITREIKQADAINVASSFLGVDDGLLSLSGVDEHGNNQIVDFYLSPDRTIVMRVNGLDVGPVTQPNTDITSFILYHFVDLDVSGIKIELSLESGTSTHYRSGKFYSSAVLR